MDKKYIDLEQIKKDVEKVFLELLESAKLKPGEAVVLGGSTSEIIGKRIGSSTNLEVAKAILDVVLPITKEKGIYLVVQGCEHINRALVVEKEYATKHNLETVNVIPVITAGGGFATAAMESFDNPVVVEKVGVQAGIDIGDVFIGMHLKGVGVVVRSDIKEIGEAHLSMVRTRPKLIGGDRAIHRKI